MELIETTLKDSYYIVPDKFADDRGYFKNIYTETFFLQNNIHSEKIVQSSRTFSKKGVLRGLHMQIDPYSQSKIIECLSGEILDVIVDLRKDSPTYKKYFSINLNPENGIALYIPKGFLHGYLAVKDDTLVQYLTDNDYNKEHEICIKWDDSTLNIDWKLKEYDIKEPILSEKDKNNKCIDYNDINLYTHKRYMIIGSKGMLGYDVIKELEKRNINDYLDLDIDDMNILDKRVVNNIFNIYKPDIVIDCAAYKDVEKAEEDIDMCMNTNVEGTRNIVEACKKIGSKLIYISSDYVFDGKITGEYEINDDRAPLNVYGKSKKIGEDIVKEYEKSFIVRTSWLFGINGNNFVNKMLELAKKQEEVNIVSEQIGSPTYTKDLSKTLIDISESDKYGIYHVTNSGYCRRTEFVKYIFNLSNMKCRVNEVTSDKIFMRAERPKNSRLSNKSLIENNFEILPKWEDSLKKYLEELEKSKV